MFNSATIPRNQGKNLYDPIAGLPNLLERFESRFREDWLDSDALPVNDFGLISAILCGGGETYSQPSGGARPSFKPNRLNGYGSAYFDGVDDILNSRVYRPTDDKESIFVLGQFWESDGFDRICGYLDERSWGCFGISNNWGYYSADGGIYSTGPSVERPWALLETHYLGSNTMTLAMNGDESSVMTCAAPPPSISSVYSVGGEGSPGSSSMGKVEIVALFRFSTNVDSTVKNIVRNYVKTIYGIGA